MSFFLLALYVAVESVRDLVAVNIGRRANAVTSPALSVPSRSGICDAEDLFTRQEVFEGDRWRPYRVPPIGVAASVQAGILPSEASLRPCGCP